MVNWWQFSDIHWPENPQPERLRFTKELLDECADRLIQKHGRPSFVVITGDLAYSGKPDEYESLYKNFIEPLKALLARDTDTPRVPILTVPGNHDLNRNEAQLLQPERVLALSSPQAIDEFLADRRTLRAYLTPFSDYSEFVRQYLDEEAADPLSWSTSIQTDGRRVVVTGVNSSWASYYNELDRDTSDERRLLLGVRQLDLDAANATDVRILVAHHPLDWLNRDICGRVEQRIRSKFDVMLFGHVHSAKDLALVSGTSGPCFLLPSPLLYGRPYEDSLEYARAFVVNQLDTVSGELRAHYYRYSDTLGAARFLPYADVYPNPDEQQYFSVTLRNGGAQPTKPSATEAEQHSNTLIELVKQSELARMFDSGGHNDGLADGAKNHSVSAFEEILVKLTGVLGPAVSQDAFEAAALAVVLVSQSIARSDSGMDERAGGRILDDLATLQPALKRISTGDLTALRGVISDLNLQRYNDSRQQTLEPQYTAALIFPVIWAIGQMAILMDQPHLISALDHAPDPRSHGQNIGSVDFEPHSGRVVLSVRTTERDEFHRLAEAKHAIEHFYANVEDIWRRTGLMPVPVKFDLSFPAWRYRSVESHTLRVDPNPISKLLMGKALYGTRPHVWLREILQNAVDAVETRRRVEGPTNFEARISLRLVSPTRLIISDNGIGMSYQHVLYYLATLGRSGWRTIERAGSRDEDPNIFGRFGIGFASVFSVAKAVIVESRQATSRSVDGVRATFSEPDRPYFVESIVAEAGTRLTVDLREALSPSELEGALSELFAYIHPAVQVDPSFELPHSLEQASVAPKGRRGRSSTSYYTSSIGATRLAGYSIRLKVELAIPRPEKRKKRGASGPVVKVPTGGLDVAVDGVRVFKEDSLSLDKFGSPRTGGSYYYSSSDSLAVQGLYVTVDFARENAPVLPSRDRLDLESSVRDELRRMLHDRYADALPALIEHAANEALDLSHTRTEVLSILRFALGNSRRHDQLSRHTPNQVERRAADAYVRHCPVVIRHAAEDDKKLVPLAEVDPTEFGIAVIASAARGRAFRVYAESRSIRSWIEVADSLELRLLEDGWPFDEGLKTLRTSSQLLRSFSDLGSEVREGPIVSLLRADYALITSDVFQSGLYLYLPTGVSAVPRDRGFSQRRNEVSPTLTPRVALNASHPLIRQLGEVLATRPDQQEVISAWLDRLCQGVIEDRNTVRAPRALWGKLQSELSERFGLTLRDMSYESLKETM
jgi:predicted phosphodiesterase